MPVRLLRVIRLLIAWLSPPCSPFKQLKFDPAPLAEIQPDSVPFPLPASNTVTTVGTAPSPLPFCVIPLLKIKFADAGPAKAAATRPETINVQIFCCIISILLVNTRASAVRLDDSRRRAAELDLIANPLFEAHRKQRVCCWSFE